MKTIKVFLYDQDYRCVGSYYEAEDGTRQLQTLAGEIINLKEEITIMDAIRLLLSKQDKMVV